MNEVNSHLRYPGGKTRAIKTILPLIPHDFLKFREPFVGGGSVFLSVKKNILNDSQFIINDLNYDLYCFWRFAQEENTQLYNAVLNIKETKTDGRKLFKYYIKNDIWTDFERAVRFFVLNRITFSGTVDSGGYSEKAFTGRFTYSSIDRIKPLEKVLSGVSIFNKTFAQDMKKCRHKWLITLDNTDKIKELFSFAYIYEWELRYGMNNYKQDKAGIGKELFI
jgi:DNA adenine methylase